MSTTASLHRDYDENRASPDTTLVKLEGGDESMFHRTNPVKQEEQGVLKEEELQDEDLQKQQQQQQQQQQQVVAVVKQEPIERNHNVIHDGPDNSSHYHVSSNQEPKQEADGEVLLGDGDANSCKELRADADTPPPPSRPARNTCTEDVTMEGLATPENVTMENESTTENMVTTTDITTETTTATPATTVPTTTTNPTRTIPRRDGNVGVLATNYDMIKEFDYSLYHSSKLFEYIDQHQWEKVMECLEEETTVAPKKQQQEENRTNNNINDDDCGENNVPLPEILELGFVNDGGCLPLHLVLVHHMRASSYDEIVPINIVKALLEKGPQYAGKRQVFSNDLPLHMACSKSFHLLPVEREEEQRQQQRLLQHHKEIIRLLLEAYPAAVWGESGEETTAFHLVAQHYSLPQQGQQEETDEDEILEMLLKCAKETSLFIKSPLSRTDCQGQLPLHVAVQYQQHGAGGAVARARMITKLIRAYPEAVRTPTSHATKGGLLPLHFAALWGCTADVLDLLLKEYIDGVSQKTNHGGDTPLHLAFHAKDNIERWTNNENANGNAANDMMKPGVMVRTMLERYYNYYNEQQQQEEQRLRRQDDETQDEPARKRRRGGVRHTKSALQMVQALLHIKNKNKWSLMKQVKECRQSCRTPSDDFERIVSDMKDLAGGTNIFDNDGSDDEEKESD